MITVGCDAATSMAAIDVAADARRRLRHGRAAPARGRHGVDTIVDLLDGPTRRRRRRVRPRLLLRPLAARRAARGVRRADPTRQRAPAAARDPHPRRVGRHVRRPRRRGRARADGLPLLHRRARRGAPVPRLRRLRQLLRHRHVQERDTDCRRRRALCPLERMLVETDSPYLAPVPHRGQPNRPAWVPFVGAVVAELREIAARRPVPARSLRTCARRSPRWLHSTVFVAWCRERTIDHGSRLRTTPTGRFGDGDHGDRRSGGVPAQPQQRQRRPRQHRTGRNRCRHGPARGRQRRGGGTGHRVVA